MRATRFRSGYATARVAGTRAGTVAAIVLSTSLMQAIVGRLAIMDALLDLCVVIATLCWYRAFEPHDHRNDVRRRTIAFPSAEQEDFRAASERFFARIDAAADDPVDRPPHLFSGTNSLHTGGERQSYLLLPVLPS